MRTSIRTSILRVLSATALAVAVVGSTDPASAGMRMGGGGGGFHAAAAFMAAALAAAAFTAAALAAAAFTVAALAAFTAVALAAAASRVVASITDLASATALHSPDLADSGDGVGITAIRIGGR